MIGGKVGNRLLNLPVLNLIKEKVNVYLPSLRMKVPDHVYALGHSYTCHTLIKYNRSA
jgi:hypothetical protein